MISPFFSAQKCVKIRLERKIMENCIFCKITKGKAEATKIYENDRLLIFMDIQPINQGHVLIIPKKHSELITEVDDKIAGEMFILAKKINIALRNSGLKCEGINYFLADGEAADQEIPHVHLHVFPRFKGDGFGFIFPNGYENLPSRDEINKIGEMIRKSLEV